MADLSAQFEAVRTSLELTREALKELDSRVSVLASEVSGIGNSVSVIRRDVDTVSSQVSSIETTLHRGNGKESVLTRMFTAEATLADVGEGLNEIKNTLKEQDKTAKQQKWQLWLAVIGAVLSAAVNWLPKLF